MTTLVDYRGLQVVSPAPTGDGGLAIQADLKNLVDWNPKSKLGQTTDPGPSDDAIHNFYPGSLWQRTDTTPPQLSICQSNTTGSAVWIPVLLAVEQDLSPKLGADLNANGHKIIGPLGINATSGGIGAFESRATSGAQIVASYDVSDYLTITVDSTGATVIDSVGTAPSVTVVDPFSVIKSANSALLCQVANANVGSSAYAAHKVAADVAQAEFAAYSSAYAGGLASTVMIGSTTNVPLLFGVNGAEAGRWSTGRNLQFNAGATSPTLATAAADTVSLCGVDKTAGDRRLYIQSESGSPINLGNDRLNFGAATGIVSIGGTDTLWVTSAKIGIGITPTENLHVSGTTRITGNVSVGASAGSSVTTDGLRLYPVLSGGTVQTGLKCIPTCGTDCTGNLYGMQFSGATSAGSYTLTNMYSIACLDAAVGAGSTVTNLFGLQIGDLTKGTNNFGIQSQVSAGSTKWNLYIPGTAQNFFQGNVGINSLIPAARLHVIDTTEACRFGYDASNYWKSTISSTGAVTLTAVGANAGFNFANPVIANNSILVSSPSSGIGYGTGAGGTVTQATSKATSVTLSKASGQITLNSAALAANTTVSFTLTNTMIAATDVLVMNHISGGTAGSYSLNAQCAAGSASINVRNVTNGSLSEAIVIQFVVIKGVVS